MSGVFQVDGAVSPSPPASRYYPALVISLKPVMRGPSITADGPLECVIGLALFEED